VKSKAGLVLAVTLLALGTAGLGAEEQFGLRVYETAKLDKAASSAVSEMMSAEAFCYRTSDSAEKVVQFYKKETGLELMGESKEGAMFRKGNVDVTIQNPWMDMKTGKLAKDTLITFLKHVE
jgi:hypothetical protein